MAAVLKKRALAEYSHVIQEEAKPQQKKLRLVHKSKHAEPQLDLQNVTCSREALHALLRFEETFPIPLHQVEQVIRTLLDHFYKEKDAAVRAKVIHLISCLVRTPDYDASMLVNDISSILQSESSHKVQSQLVATLTAVGTTQSPDRHLLDHILHLAIQALAVSHHSVRCKCLELISLVGSPDMPQEVGDHLSASGATLYKILADYTQDRDPRVRTSAFRASLTWHERGIKIEQSMYDKVCAALNDDYEGVRLAAVKLTWVLSQLYPDRIISVQGSDRQIRIIDDGFAKICDMVNDLSMKVRAEAVGLLGSLHKVSPHFLEQTLDKKLMSNMRLKQSAHQRQREHYQSGEWSTGQKWADDAPKEEVDPNAVDLMASGACGAFVHGLEDEYLEVRNASIDSVCALATLSPQFAAQSQDFLVDMLNDEIEGVRLNALNCLRKIGHQVKLREDQLEIIIGTLKDFSSEIRDALREMFCVSRMGTKACLHGCINSMLENLNRYPEDKESIWKCMKSLGLNHPTMTLPMVPELLCNHPYFDSPEPDMDDPAYIAILILVFNAAMSCPTMPNLLPEHTFQHYVYLRDALPDLVPVLRLPGIPTEVLELSKKTEVDASDFLNAITKRLEGVGRMDEGSAEELINMSVRDLQRVTEMDPSLSATAECLCLYLQCQLLLVKVNRGQSSQMGGQSSAFKSAIDKVLNLTEQMEHLFRGLSIEELATIRQIRLQAQTLELVSKLQSVQAPSNEHKTICIHYLQLVNQLQRLTEKTGQEVNSFTQYLFSEMHKLELSEFHQYPALLLPALKRHTITVMKVQNKVHRVRATITEPSTLNETPLKLTAGMTAGVNIVAQLEHIEHAHMLRVKVKYPDQQCHLSIPKVKDLKELSPGRHRLNTQVLLSHTIWSEACPVELSLALCSSNDAELAEGDQKPTKNDACSSSSILEISKPVKVLVLPKAAKR